MTRHSDLARYCAWLHRIWAGEHVEVLPAPSGPVGIAVLPMFVWADDHGATGRKSSARRADNAAGPRVLMPARVRYPLDGSVILMEPGTTRTIPFEADSPGISLTGELMVRCLGQTRAFDATSAETLFADPGSDGRMVVPVLDDPERAFEYITAQAKMAVWETIEWATPLLAREVTRAHANLRISVAEETGQPEKNWIDETSAEMIVDQLCFGDENGPGSLTRLLVLAQDPYAFVKVDPLKHAVTHLRRDAGQLVRVKVGDPRAGSKIRKLARELGTTDVTQIVSEYRQRYPKDEVGTGRVHAALNLAGDVSAHAISLELLR